ncbi:MAG: threonine--tRNA ligase [Defluviitaleaceae bacterium]|nr:threonine--tRNA ligase [Defluviitaleaceae bacterium]
MGKINMDDDYIAKARHSMAHVLAKAVCQLFDDVKLAIGPPIENGFYYDFDLPHTIREEDFAAIEQRMTEIMNNNEDYTFRRLDNAEEILVGEPYKLELVKEIREAGEEVTAYDLGEGFFDLCAGPHVENTRELRNWGFKIASVAGAYWRGSSDNAMLQRVYVHAFPTRQELKKHLQFLEEAKKRDHRVLGPQLDLMFFDETAPGMPYWLPKGWKLYNTLMDFTRRVHEQRGYQEIAGPQLNHRTLWETSGHWEHYHDDMFTIDVGNEQYYALKPMNCPNAMIAFGRTNRSYRELPLRYMETSLLHRKEASGTLHGLLRVQTFRQDDAHTFITEEQIHNEINEILDLTNYLYGVFGLTVMAYLSTRPEEGYLGEIEQWNHAEEQLKRVLDDRFAGNYQINEGDGAFYGPKIDLKVKDVLNREWQLGTIQLDFQLAARFGLHYTDSDGKQKAPVVIHRALFGSLERFIGILIEHFAGKFPFWLSPVQIGVVPVHTDHEEYSHKVTQMLRDAGYRTNIDTSDGTMGNKIKSFRHEMMPYIIIIGEKEMEGGTISLRTRSGVQINEIPLHSFMEICKKMETEHLIELIEEI